MARAQPTGPPSPGVSNSNFSEGQMRNLTRGPHYAADETMAIPELF